MSTTVESESAQEQAQNNNPETKTETAGVSSEAKSVPMFEAGEHATIVQPVISDNAPPTPKPEEPAPPSSSAPARGRGRPPKVKTQADIDAAKERKREADRLYRERMRGKDAGGMDAQKAAAKAAREAAGLGESPDATSATPEFIASTASAISQHKPASIVAANMLIKTVDMACDLLTDGQFSAPTGEEAKVHEGARNATVESYIVYLDSTGVDVPPWVVCLAMTSIYASRAFHKPTAKERMSFIWHKFTTWIKERRKA